MTDDHAPLYAILDEISFQELKALDCSFIWHIYKPNGKVMIWTKSNNPKTPNSRRPIFIDRLIADCQAHQGVMPFDGNHLNMRRSNQVIGFNTTAKKARDIIPYAKRPKYEVIEVRDY